MDDLLREQYLQALGERVEEIKLLVKDYRPGNPEQDKKIRTLAHSLHGSGGSFGFPLISELARTTEHASEAELLKSLTALVKEIRRVIAAPPSPAADTVEQNKPASASAPEPATTQSSTSGVRKVLIIEDDENCVGLVRQALQSLDPTLHITVAPTAMLAQEALVKTVFTIIVLDLILPDRDGREVLREIKVDFKLVAPVLVLSGITRDLVRVECMSLGADRYVHKPITSPELAKVLQSLLQQSAKPPLTLVPKGNELKKPDTTQAATTRQLQDISILVAEDDLIQAKLIKQQLGKEGISLDHAENGRHALQFLRQKKYSLVILDIQMPMVSGFEVLEKMRTELEMKNVPVIIVSAMGSEQDIIKGYDLGANDYLLKPYSPVQLVARVKSLLKLRRPAG